MQKREAILLSGLFLFLVSCGKKGPPSPPPPPQKVKPSSNKPVKGFIGYQMGDDGYIALYWDFPVKVDLYELYLNGKKIATLKGSIYLYPKPLEKGKSYTFKVVGYKGGKPVAQTEIKVSP